jgi:uncharacterized phage protein gp47/JayE
VFQLLTFTTLVQRFAASVQASASASLDFTVGSILRAIAEANASAALWVQWLIVLLAGKIRAATSQGTDLDSWMADFGLIRLPATAATGTVTFSRFTASTSAFIPVLTQVKTADGSTSFQVIADTTQTYWSVSLNGYLIPAGVASGNATVQAIPPGATGNVLANQISLISSGIAGIDTVNNALALTNGIIAEADGAFRARFQAFMATRARATLAAVAYAISSVQSGLSWTIQENTSGGAYQLGNFVVTVDDGSGSPPSSLLTAIYAAIDAVRPVGTTFAVFGPIEVTVTAGYTITVAPPGVKAAVLAATETAVAAYLSGLPMGGDASYFKVSQVIFATDPSIINIGGFTLNGGTSDVVIAPGQVAKAGTITAIAP